MTLLAVDVGTTHCKAALVREDGALLAVARRPTIARRAAEGWAFFSPDELWSTVRTVIGEVLPKAPGESISALGIASMAETGLLVDRLSGAPRSPLLPWFDTASRPQAQVLREQTNPLERFCATGVRATFKCSVSKLLWLRERDPKSVEGAVWLSTADYIAYRLTGRMVTDYTLAGRTFAFDIGHRQWDGQWLESLGLSPDLFPEALPGGTVIGRTRYADNVLPSGTPVVIAGHDHVCAALAVGATEPGRVLDSIGTAESLVGALPALALGRKEYESGLVFGCHVLPEAYYWMGGLSSSGGAVEWLRSLIGEPAISYDELDSLLERGNKTPTGILFYPFLLGNVPGEHSVRTGASIVGLDRSDGRGELARAVLEGTAFEMEQLRRAGASVTGRPIEQMVATGGGTKLAGWLQIKADVYGMPVHVAASSEATLVGAAMLAGVGAGVFADARSAATALAQPDRQVIRPDAQRHSTYRELFERQYIPFRQALLATRSAREASGKGNGNASRRQEGERLPAGQLA